MWMIGLWAAAAWAAVLVPAAQASPEDLFREGNAAYQSGDFDGAVKAYESIVQSGMTAPELEYNLGNAYLKAGSVGQAILHYRRALESKPGYEDAQKNLAFARRRTRDVQQSTEGEHSWLARFGLSTPMAAGMVLLSVSLLCLWGVVRLLWLPRHLAGSILSGVLTGFLLLTAVGLLYQLTSGKGVQEGVVLAEDIEVRSGPGKEFTVHFHLHEGSEVELIRESGGWREIRISDELQGWIPVTSVASIE